MNINYLSDFKLLERSDVLDESTPFKFTYYTTPTQSYVASFDGETYTNCRLNDDGDLLVIFNNHGLSIGDLCVKREYYLNDDDFADGVYSLTSTDSTGISLSTFRTTDTVGTLSVHPNYQRGYSAYEVAQQNGFSGNQSEWLASIASYTTVIENFDSSSNQMQPNIFYVHSSAPLSINIDLADPLDNGEISEYMLTFTTGSVPAVIFIPDSVSWIGSVDSDGAPLLSANTTYEVNIVGNRGIIVAW